VALVVLLFIAAANCYSLTSYWHGSSFFDNFSFFTQDDPTHGYVNYVSRSQASSDGLIYTSNGAVIIAADSTHVASGRGRNSVRISSNLSWNSGLFVLDLNHMPAGCGTWPAWWLCGPNWPNNGEIDIIEGVNVNTADTTTLHTSQGCDQTEVNSNSFKGTWGTGSNGRPATNCWVDAPNQFSNQGCGIVSPAGNYGSAVNSMGGGVYALLLNGTRILFYFWTHSQVPADLRNNNPDPNGWGEPYGFFIVGNSNCPASHFQSLQIIINLTFCGDWAGNVFQSDCPGKGSCNAFVQNNPSNFAQSYWSINFLKVFT